MKRHAYWGADKYYQKKATIVPSGVDGGEIISFTDYYSRNESNAGYRGQVEKVYSTGVDSSVTTSFEGRASTNWRNILAPSSGAIASAKFPTDAYDSKGRVVRVDKLQKVTGGTGTYVTTTTTYGDDGTTWWGNPRTVTEAAGVSGVARTTETFEYDAAGRTVDSQDAKGRRMETDYDLDGRILSVTQKDDDGNSGTSFTPVEILEYTYGTSGVAKGQLLTATDNLSQQEQTIEYETASGAALGQVKRVISTDLAANVGAFNSYYTYRADGSRESVRYTGPDTERRQAFHGYITVGSMAKMQRVPTRMSVVTGAGLTETAEQFRYAYDSSGRLVESDFAHNFDGSGFTDFSGTSTDDRTSFVRQSNAYDHAGRQTTVLYQQFQEVSNAPGTFAGTQMRRVDYTYNEVNSRRGTFTVKDGANSTLYSDTYTYNPNLGYLTDADYSNITDGSWTYDASGNRSNSGYAYDELNRMTNSPSTTYLHDVVGNRTRKTSGSSRTDSMWDSLNRMTGTESYYSNQLSGSVGYRYRADGLRTQKVMSNEESSVPVEELSSYYDFNSWRNDRTWLYHYDGQMSVTEVYKGETHEAALVRDSTRNYLGARGIDMIEAERVQAPSGDPLLNSVRKQYPLYDGHGNMMAAVIRGSGTSYSLVNERRFDAWGATASSTSPGAALAKPSEGYCANIGHKADAESGLIYMRARYYEPSSGRFISQDPAMDGRNWYAYCTNDPVNAIDESGRSDFQVMWCAFAAFAIVFLYIGAKTNHMGKAFLAGCVAAGGAALIAFGSNAIGRATEMTALATFGTRFFGGGFINAVAQLMIDAITGDSPGWDILIAFLCGGIGAGLVPTFNTWQEGALGFFTNGLGAFIGELANFMQA